MNSLFRFCQYIKHFLLSGDEHSVHSPFLFYLYTTTIHTDKQFYAFSKIESFRNRALKDKTTIAVTDFGTGKDRQRHIADIVSRSVTDASKAQILFRLAWFIKAKTILELGTSLGFTTAYLASANTQSTVFSLEGCPNLAAYALRMHKRLNINNTRVYAGDIAKTLPSVIQTVSQIDLAFLDANHQYKPTLEYFEILLPYMHENSIMIFDDIYWSPDMKKAWDTIIAREEITISIDLFHFGIVFFRKNAPKQHFNLRI